MSEEKVLKSFFTARDRVDVITSVRDSEKMMAFLLKYAGPGFSWYVDVGPGPGIFFTEAYQTRW